jgi:6-phosphogluconolactonase
MTLRRKTTPDREEDPLNATPEVFVHASGDLLASAAAARTVTRLADAVNARGRAHLVLTGGGIGTKVIAAIHASAALDAVDWRQVDFWWGDERFEPAGDPERNETGARSALLDHIGVDPARVHVMHGPDGLDGDDPDAAAARYAAELATSARQCGAPAGAAVPVFDVLMLGIGPEGHVASIFPDAPATRAAGSVVAVRNSPKPPPTRLSLTFSAIQAAREVWILASGGEKADAVAEALSGVSPDKLPAAGARGLDRTLFLLDEQAATGMPVPLLGG